MNMEKNDSVPCPMCCNSKTPGQIDRPIGGKWDIGMKDEFGLDELPEMIMSLPCPMCHGEQRISSEQWNAILSRARKLARKHMDKKPKPKVEKKQDPTESMWGQMKRIKAEQNEMWFGQGPFPFKKAE